MNKKYLLRIDILNMLLRYMVIFTLTSFVILVFTTGDEYIWKSLTLFQASVISFIIRKCTKHIWSYTILQLLLLTSYLLLTDDFILRIIYSIYIVVFAISEFALDINRKVKNTALGLCVIIMGMYALCKYAYPEEVLLGQFFFCIGIVFGIIYIINMYMINFYFYMQKHEEKANIPIKQIKASSTFFASAFLFLSLTVMLLFSGIPTEGILRMIWGAVRNFLRFVFAGMVRKPNITTEEPNMEPGKYDQNIFDEFEVPEPSEFWLAVSKILVNVCAVLCVVLLIALIIYGLYRVYQLYYGKKVTPVMEEQVETLNPFRKDDIIHEGERGGIRRAIASLFGRSNNDKIRKHYSRAIQKKNKEEQNLKYKTPSELSEYALEDSAKQKEQMLHGQRKEALTVIYEKARYSNKECSKEELQSVKDILK